MDKTVCYNTVAIWKAGNVVAITIMVSACLLGLPTDYQGSTKNQSDYLISIAKQFNVVPFCPEQLGGLPTPRIPSEIEAGDAAGTWCGHRCVRRQDGEDVTAEFKRGAEITLAIARLVNPRMFVMKDRSPSCGVNLVYDGSFSHIQVSGVGLATFRLLEFGYKVCSGEDASVQIDTLIKE